MNCCICGPIKNCATFLNKVIDNIELIGKEVFSDYLVVLYYNHSEDNSLEILKNRQSLNPKIIIYNGGKCSTPYRTHNIAIARNFCLKFVRRNSAQYPFFIMMDMDNVNCKEINLNPLKQALLRTDWDGLSFNTLPYYYDIWALSIYPFCFSYNHFHNNYQYHSIIRDYVMDCLKKKQAQNMLLPCISSFNGFSIYRTTKFLNTYYDGRVRHDLFPNTLIHCHAIAQQSIGGKIVYKDYGHIKGRYEDCEHRSFHRMAILNSKARIMISPEILFNG